jgi:hypothetical protein
MGLRRSLSEAYIADVPQRQHELSGVFNALRWLVRAGVLPWLTIFQEFHLRLHAKLAEARHPWIKTSLR